MLGLTERKKEKCQIIRFRIFVLPLTHNMFRTSNCTKFYLSQLEILFGDDNRLIQCYVLCIRLGKIFSRNFLPKGNFISWTQLLLASNHHLWFLSGLLLSYFGDRNEGKETIFSAKDKSKKVAETDHAIAIKSVRKQTILILNPC